MRQRFRGQSGDYAKIGKSGQPTLPPLGRETSSEGRRTRVSHTCAVRGRQQVDTGFEAPKVVPNGCRCVRTVGLRLVSSEDRGAPMSGPSPVLPSLTPTGTRSLCWVFRLPSREASHDRLPSGPVLSRRVRFTYWRCKCELKEITNQFYPSLFSFVRRLGGGKSHLRRLSSPHGPRLDTDLGVPQERSRTLSSSFPKTPIEKWRHLIAYKIVFVNEILNA